MKLNVSTVKTPVAILLLTLVAVQNLAQAANQEEQLGKNGQPAPEPYSFSYTSDSIGGSSTHQERGDGTGRVSGFYTIMGEDGRERRVDYVADENGYRATIKTNEVGTRSENSADAQYSSELPSAKQLEQAKVSLDQYRYLEDTHLAERERQRSKLNAIYQNSRQEYQFQQAQRPFIQTSINQQLTDGFKVQFANQNGNQFIQNQVPSQQVDANDIDWQARAYNSRPLLLRQRDVSQVSLSELQNLTTTRNNGNNNINYSSSLENELPQVISYRQTGELQQQPQLQSKFVSVSSEVKGRPIIQQQLGPITNWQSVNRVSSIGRRPSSILQRQLEAQFLQQAKQLTDQDYPRQQTQFGIDAVTGSNVFVQPTATDVNDQQQQQIIEANRRVQINNQLLRNQDSSLTRQQQILGPLNGAVGVNNTNISSFQFQQQQQQQQSQQPSLVPDIEFSQFNQEQSNIIGDLGDQSDQQIIANGINANLNQLDQTDVTKQQQAIGKQTVQVQTPQQQQLQPQQIYDTSLNQVNYTSSTSSSTLGPNAFGPIGSAQINTGVLAESNSTDYLDQSQQTADSDYPVGGQQETFKGNQQIGVSKQVNSATYSSGNKYNLNQREDLDQVNQQQPFKGQGSFAGNFTSSIQQTQYEQDTEIPRRPNSVNQIINYQKQTTASDYQTGDQLNPIRSTIVPIRPTVIQTNTTPERSTSRLVLSTLTPATSGQPDIQTTSYVAQVTTLANYPQPVTTTPAPVTQQRPLTTSSIYTTTTDLNKGPQQQQQVYLESGVPVKGQSQVYGQTNQFLNRANGTSYYGIDSQAPVQSNIITPTTSTLTTLSDSIGRGSGYVNSNSNSNININNNNQLLGQQVNSSARNATLVNDSGRIVNGLVRNSNSAGYIVNGSLNQQILANQQATELANRLTANQLQVDALIRKGTKGGSRGANRRQFWQQQQQQATSNRLTGVSQPIGTSGGVDYAQNSNNLAFGARVSPSSSS